MKAVPLTSQHWHLLGRSKFAWRGTDQLQAFVDGSLIGARFGELAFESGVGGRGIAFAFSHLIFPRIDYGQAANGREVLAIASDQGELIGQGDGRDLRVFG